MRTRIVLVTSDQNEFGTLGNEKGLDIDNKETMHYELSPDQRWPQMSFVHLFGCCPIRLSLILIRSALDSTKTQLENFSGSSGDQTQIQRFYGV